jgi:hypothetical protein
VFGIFSLLQYHSKRSSFVKTAKSDPCAHDKASSSACAAPPRFGTLRAKSRICALNVLPDLSYTTLSLSLSLAVARMLLTHLKRSKKTPPCYGKPNLDKQQARNRLYRTLLQ